MVKSESAVCNLLAFDHDDEACVKLRLKDGPDVMLRISNTTTGVDKAIGKELQKPEGSINVLHGSELIEFRTSFADNGIEDRATLSVVDNEAAILALKNIQKLAPTTCSYTEINLTGDHFTRRNLKSLPDGEHRILALFPPKWSNLVLP